MAGVWKKTLNYLGLVEDEEDFVDEYSDVQPAPVRQMRPQAIRDVPAGSEGIVRTIAAPRTATGPSAIHKSEPKRFNEARDVADRFKEGAAVIMNLQSTEDATASAETPRAGSRWMIRRPSVRMIRHPPDQVPSEIADAASTITHQGSPESAET